MYDFGIRGRLLGTSFPEFIVSINASIMQESSIVFGNVMTCFGKFRFKADLLDLET